MTADSAALILGLGAIAVWAVYTIGLVEWGKHLGREFEKGWKLREAAIRKQAQLADDNARRQGEAARRSVQWKAFDWHSNPITDEELRQNGIPTTTVVVGEGQELRDHGVWIKPGTTFGDKS